MTDTLTRLNTALPFLEGKLIFHTILGFTGRGGGKKQRVLSLKDYYVETHRFTY